jgi:hypothetical protein
MLKGPGQLTEWLAATGVAREVLADAVASFTVARARILAAIGSPEGAAEANALAPVGGQLGLL